MTLEKLTCFVYSEGGKDKKFLEGLIFELEKFHAKKWFFNLSNASGGSASFILRQCHNIVKNLSYNVVICFIDLDRLKAENPKEWKKEKKELEKKYLDHNISIIWFEDNIEEELNRVLGGAKCGKWKTNKKARDEVKKFKNSKIWKEILNILKNKEL